MEYTGTENLKAMEGAENYNAYLLSLAGWAVRPGEDGVDFGSGRGTFAVPMLRSGRHITCVEPDEASLAILRKHGLTTYKTLRDVPAESFDGAWTFNVLEHIGDDAAVLRDLWKVLRPGGRLAIYVPAFPVLFSAMDTYVGHRRRYRHRRRSLATLVEASGLHVERAAYVDCLGFFAALAYRFMADRTGKLDPMRSAFTTVSSFP